MNTGVMLKSCKFQKYFLNQVVALMLGVWSSSAFALLEQTAGDLTKLEDDIRYRISKDPNLYSKMVPMLVSSPTHHWVESREDFSDSVFAILNSIFKEEGDLIQCVECDTHRLHMRKDNNLTISNGPLTINEYQKLKKVSKYRDAKAVVTVKETPSGVVMRIVSIDDGSIIYFNLADSSKNLDDVRPWMNFSKEYDRRKREEALSYIRINMGLYPQPLIQIDFQEQWGRRNEHISGVTVSLVGPIGAIGLNYRYIVPEYKRVDIGLGVYFPLQNLVLESEDASDALSSQVYQVMASWAFADSFGLFADFAFGGETVFTMGISFYNPMLFPFLL